MSLPNNLSLSGLERRLSNWQDELSHGGYGESLGEEQEGALGWDNLQNSGE